ncbi:hypothetical protein C8Q75DRAFT_309442 [Abortiporus biennis]|nr:hypothetical protein C8Q75DRAFT_309442 [Abortiporus biennis]
MSGDISWMKKGLKKRRPGEWFSEPNAKQSPTVATNDASGTERNALKDSKVVSSQSNLEKEESLVSNETLKSISGSDVTKAYKSGDQQDLKTLISSYVRQEVDADDAWKMHDSEDSLHYVITTLPPPYSKGSKKRNVDPDGVAECLLYAPTKRMLMNFPRFPQKIRHPTTICYEIRDIPGRGKGVIALQDIEAGDLIIAERPLTITPNVTLFPDHHGSNPKYSEHAPGEYKEAEELFAALLERMDPSRKADFMDIQNCHEHDGGGPFWGRASTNAFSAVYAGDTRSNPHASDCCFTGKLLSRVNHSCCPNAGYSTHKPSLSMELRAVRKITKGEEITVCYMTKDLGPTTQRQLSLSPYKFTCTCPLCIRPAISDLTFDILRKIDLNPATISLPVDVVSKYIELIEEWQLESYPVYQMYLIYLSFFSIGKGDLKSALETSYKGIRNMLGRNGRDPTIQFIKEHSVYFGRAGSQVLAWQNFV